MDWGRPFAARARLVFFLACLASRSSSAASSPSGCPGDSSFDRSSVVRLATPMPEPRLQTHLDTAAIEALRPSAPGQARVPGLTLAQYSLNKDYHVSWSRQSRSSRLCVWVDSLELEFAYSRLEVYVSREYPRDTCEWTHVHRHEMEHVEVHRRLHQHYAALMAKALVGAGGPPTRANPAAVESSEAGRRLIEKVIAQATQPLYERFQEELAAEQAKLDTPESYRVLQGLCPGWRGD